LGSVFRRESTHHQRQLAVWRHVDGGQINPLHVFRDTSASAIYFHNEFCIFHMLSLLLSSTEEPCAEMQQSFLNIIGPQPGRWRKKLKEVLAAHGHRNWPVHNPEFSSLREADTQSLFFVSRGNPRQADFSLCIFHPLRSLEFGLPQSSAYS
jgi:hypothetical protein